MNLTVLFRNFESLTALKVHGGERSFTVPMQRLHRFTKATEVKGEKPLSPLASGEILCASGEPPRRKGTVLQ